MAAGAGQIPEELFSAQRAFFLQGHTRPYGFRVAQLRRLHQAIAAREREILAALRHDLGKPAVEAYAAEVAFVQGEIRYALRNLKGWMRPQRVPTPLPLQPASSWVQPEPLGQVLIISPWNYPFQLALAPLVGAIAAGNVAVVKPSELAPATARVVAAVVGDALAPEHVAVVQGGPEVAQALLARPWDHIFFTGSTAVGRLVARAAAEHLTPVTLELGGKSPCLVDRDADLAVTARRIAWGKFFNAGQTCVAPDFVLVHREVHDALVEQLRRSIREFFGPDPRQSEDYGRIVSRRHFDRLAAMLADGQVAVGGEAWPEELYISPTVLTGVPLEARCMQEEIFGPILPVLPFGSLEEAIHLLRRFPRPLALYVFSRNRAVQEQVLSALPFGGGCVNNTLVHLSNPALPFGGVGESGMGAYHGRHSFDTFSHRKAIVRSPLWGDLRLKYPPYRGKFALLRRLLG